VGGVEGKREKKFSIAKKLSSEIPGCFVKRGRRPAGLWEGKVVEMGGSEANNLGACPRFWWGTPPPPHPPPPPQNHGGFVFCFVLGFFGGPHPPPSLQTLPPPPPPRPPHHHPTPHKSPHPPKNPPPPPPAPEGVRFQNQGNRGPDGDRAIGKEKPSESCKVGWNLRREGMCIWGGGTFNQVRENWQILERKNFTRPDIRALLLKLEINGEGSRGTGGEGIVKKSILTEKPQGGGEW